MFEPFHWFSCMISHYLSYICSNIGPCHFFQHHLTTFTFIHFLHWYAYHVIWDLVIYIIYVTDELCLPFGWKQFKIPLNINLTILTTMTMTMHTSKTMNLKNIWDWHFVITYNCTKSPSGIFLNCSNEGILLLCQNIEILLKLEKLC